MRSKLLSIFVTLGLIGMAQAHHSGSVYDSTKRQTWTGTLSKVDWVGPHILVYLDVKDAGGKLTTWTYEGSPPAWYRHHGVKRSDAEKGLGQTVKIVGLPARSGIPLGRLQSIVLADGTSTSFDLTDVGARQQPPASQPR